MLVLSRKVTEQIVIGEGPDAITIVIVDVDRGKVRVGVSAPRNVRIMRKELLDNPPPNPFDPEKNPRA